MHISRIKIQNFRGIDIEIDNLEKDFLIMGKNDSGKSNICFAIRKVLDYNVRRNPLTENDSSNFNKEKIFIELSFLLDPISLKNKNALGPHIETDDQGRDILNVFFEGIFNKDLMVYEEKLFFGAIEREEKTASSPNFLDKALEIIYINPNYDIEYDKRVYFKKKRDFALENENRISDKIKSAIETLNAEIQKDSDISAIVKDISESEDTSIFEDTGFEIQSNIEPGNVYKSLDVIPVDKNTGQRIGIGDGKNKTLSLLLQKLSYFSDKQKIFIVEEPENHLFPLLQKSYLGVISMFNADQLIFTTHSPFIVDFKKIHQLIKLHVSYDSGKRITGSKSINVVEDDYSKYGYLLNSELAEMLFCDKVLLVEGYSEKYFYNYLYLVDETFRKYLNENKMGVFAVNGIAFGSTKALLEKLGITVFIKTDNDIYEKKGYYAGLSRCFDCLSKNDQLELSRLLNPTPDQSDKLPELFRTSNKETLESNMTKIVGIYYKNGVFLSVHHEGFEKDFLNFIGSSCSADLDELREAKLKNLHNYIVDRHISLSINDNNKDNILVRFMSNEPFK